MKKVFHWTAPREKYHCDAVIVWCFDNRFELGFRKFLKRNGVVNSDPIKIAGGPRAWSHPIAKPIANSSSSRFASRFGCTAPRAPF
jgi:hypothetical protein